MTQQQWQCQLMDAKAFSYPSQETIDGVDESEDSEYISYDLIRDDQTEASPRLKA